MIVLQYVYISEKTMDFITIRDFRTEPGKIWEKLENEGDLVVTRNGKPFAILIGTSPTGLEEDLNALRRARFGKALTAIRADAKRKGLDRMTMDEINELIRKVREDRRNAGST